MAFSLPCCDTGFGTWAYERCRREYWQILNEFEKRKLVASQIDKLSKLTAKTTANNFHQNFIKAHQD
uniref:Uncharacterized protein n=1 Tax=Acrobeloides nanus TaxID=290746 RepID=A0A914DXV4_9BILA